MSHWYLCTWNNPQPEPWLKITAAYEPDWIIGQREIGESGTEHLQFVLYFKVQKYAKELLKKLSGVYMAKKPASAADDIIAYCQKTESAVPNSKFEFGRKPRTGAKSPVAQFDTTLDSLKKGNIPDVDAEHQVKYFGNLLKLKAFYSKTDDAQGVRGTWIYGPPGSGKSWKARQLAGDAGFYAKPQNKWWDLYNGEKTVILDDLDEGGACLSHLLKIWLDRYAFTAETKGGSIRPDYDRFIITSNYVPEELWPAKPLEVQAIRRRCEFIYIGSAYLSNLNNLLI